MKLTSRRARAWGKFGFALVAIAAATAANTACPTDATGPKTLASLDISPSPIVITIGATQQLTLRAIGENDAPIVPRSGQATWSTGDKNIATVSGDGGSAVLTAVAPGTTSVGVTFGGKTASAQVTVTSAKITVRSVTITPGNASLPAGTLGQLTATPYDSLSQAIGGRSASWGSSNNAVATVDSTGRITALSPGAITVLATIDGKSATTTVTVTNPVARLRVTPSESYAVVDERIPLTATLLDAGGTPLTPTPGLLVRPISWHYNTAYAASVDASGIVTALTSAYNYGKVWAEFSNMRDTAQIWVRRKVGTIAIAPNPLTLNVGDTVTLATSYREPNGDQVVLDQWPAGKRATVSVGSSSIATANDDGNPKAVGQIFVRGVAAGSTSITVSIDGATTTVPVTVVAPRPQIDRVTISPSSANLTVGQQRALSAVALDRAGQPIASPGAATWSTSDASVVTVSQSGTIVGTGVGRATISATIAGYTGTATVDVAPAPSGSSVTLTPTYVHTIKRLADGGTQTFQSSLYAGDHDLNGDKSLQGFLIIALDKIPASATIDAATITVTVATTNLEGNPFSLGALMVERAATPVELNEGSIDASAVQTLGAVGQRTVDVKTLLDQARSAGLAYLYLRFRFQQLTNNNGVADYASFSASALTVTYH